ncbi:hypothetical protein DAPPUDRAFT_253082 [Daphnia pulex]|uniref:Uncharacterized protein n=1 Tax=Daphnia pulex TaxID=6669 RepID=E9H451_DAPPU|nr:hypothetical protein DAPPUDRAFT_253082 [Daphnia pulex]|eukprot:EFX73451.1 hypothetical protein DAPPUDRAFT_253082 [Daphnia pulex]
MQQERSALLRFGAVNVTDLITLASTKLNRKAGVRHYFISKIDLSFLLPLTFCELQFNLLLKNQPVQFQLHLQEQPNQETPNSGFLSPGECQILFLTSRIHHLLQIHNVGPYLKVLRLSFRNTNTSRSRDSTLDFTTEDEEEALKEATLSILPKKLAK